MASAALIRAATVEDIPRLLAIERQAEQASHWAENEYSAMFESQSPRRIVLVADDESGMHGFGVARLVHPGCEIENLVVSPVMRRRGIGMRLLSGLIDRAREQGAITFFLEVRELNIEARALYNRVGFRECGRRKAYYQNPEDNAILYCL
ncbi:MAG: ribosomal protein S18-alanine N-acetyltransferase [Terriglobales bacterium]